MKWIVATVGRPALGYARVGLQLYLDRIAKAGWPVEHVVVRDRGGSTAAEALLTATEGTLRIVLDEKGKALATLEWARWLEERQIEGRSSFSLLIGGGDGHEQATRAAADLVLSLSAFTLQHELAALVAAEQLYRVQCVMRGHPYHREG